MQNRTGSRRRSIAALAVLLATTAATPAFALGARIDDNGFFSWVMALFTSGDEGERGAGLDPNG